MASIGFILMGRWLVLLPRPGHLPPGRVFPLCDEPGPGLGLKCQRASKRLRRWLACSGCRARSPLSFAPSLGRSASDLVPFPILPEQRTAEHPAHPVLRIMESTCLAKTRSGAHLTRCQVRGVHCLSVSPSRMHMTAAHCFPALSQFGSVPSLEAGTVLRPQRRSDVTGFKRGW
jgi:hypothetical protein